MYFTKRLFKIRLNFYDRFQRFISIKKLINVKTNIHIHITHLYNFVRQVMPINKHLKYITEYTTKGEN